MNKAFRASVSAIQNKLPQFPNGQNFLIPSINKNSNQKFSTVTREIKKKKLFYYIETVYIHIFYAKFLQNESDSISGNYWGKRQHLVHLLGLFHFCENLPLKCAKDKVKTHAEYT